MQCAFLLNMEQRGEEEEKKKKRPIKGDLRSVITQHKY